MWVGSARSEDDCDLLWNQLGCWSPGTRPSAKQWHKHDHAELCPREVEDDRNACENDLLENHGEAHNDSDHNTQEATGANKDEGFIEIQQLDSEFGEAHGSEDTNFGGLIHKVGAHTRAEGEEAQEHGDRNDDIKDNIKDQLHLFHGISVIIEVEDSDTVRLFSS